MFLYISSLIISSMNGALVAAIYQTLREAKSGGVAGRIRLNGDEDNNGEISKASQGEAIDNPLAHIDIPRKTVIIMFAVSVVGSVISAFIFTVRSYYTQTWSYSHLFHSLL
jgi:hypothetical protein